MKELRVNNTVHRIDVLDDTPLLWALRDHLGLTGTKYGCGVSECGACTVHVDGQAMRSCAVPVSAFRGSEDIVTIEGLGAPTWHVVQQVWKELDVAQCGYCQPGMIMAVAALLQNVPDPTDEDIRSEITNICRCGTYPRVIAGIKLAAERMKEGVQ
ncbi:(2Fe-2S)-binding protein [Agrobacterium genomosp. 3]|jgi:isoquinoline 1-oxidoreductase alpha subunit|uniref:(2Fe-2S)-binding protein n=1 Tax=Agrobacterium TaxID=357 RepID=UPI001CD8EA88|nr:(2Fe-2S)-binding protein [Agrobacterium pusense]MCA1867943.1 (2Fe-2S)-binding protein [Agrobacterium tomkonis]MCA1878364.1 (2Fe-2S)-binding protein [Agrobacterium tumefaciens]MCA1893518.1 (2Fe-2S)-binding protein [Agrobacterium tomkonis]MDH0117050.1 (2Fe-2S)-binding protein [Agrobacterium pusense]MDH0872576.1 (2Fe-2S)-binding protein [Agrobacterium pusense]